ncbi:hypothetical protein H2200_009694 [Cladophialophora chaetospira]|uniref:Uncharacterized protein n=1 Tax=Cladophialophora chaetospira TaxID=386627 RepID=A0AA38X359_9EURO|nr:hypothetical protein H2200_009694 [Cladophialophora chaetospira]
MSSASTTGKQAPDLPDVMALVGDFRSEALFCSALPQPEEKRFLRALKLIAAGRHPREVAAMTKFTEYDLITYMARSCAISRGISDNVIAHERRMMTIVPIRNATGKMAMLEKDKSGWFVEIGANGDSDSRLDCTNLCASENTTIDASSIAEDDCENHKEVESGTDSVKPPFEEDQDDPVSEEVPQVFIGHGECPVGSRFGILSVDEELQDEEIKSDAESLSLAKNVEEQATSVKKNEKRKKKTKKAQKAKSTRDVEENGFEQEKATKETEVAEPYTSPITSTALSETTWSMGILILTNMWEWVRALAGFVLEKLGY